MTSYLGSPRVFPLPHITSTVFFAMNTKVIYVYESQMCILHVLYRLPAREKCLLLFIKNLETMTLGATLWEWREINNFFFTWMFSSGISFQIHTASFWLICHFYMTNWTLLGQFLAFSYDKLKILLPSFCNNAQFFNSQNHCWSHL